MNSPEPCGTLGTMGRGRGSGHGAVRGAMSARSAQLAIAGAGGLMAAIRASDPERFDALSPGRLEQVQRAYHGAPRSAVTDIATGKRMATDSGKQLPPIRVTVMRDRDGKHTYHIEDGRNRSLGAEGAGATHIRAMVSREHQSPRGKWRFSKPVELIIKL